MSKRYPKDYDDDWQQALAEFGAQLPMVGAFSEPIYVVGQSADETIAGFVKVGEELTRLEEQNSSTSLRTLSARCFAGRSKALDDRRGFLEHFYPYAQSGIQPRAIMMSVYVPEELEVALFIENFDSFRSTVSALAQTPHASRIAIIYSAGFRSSAEQIRELGNVQFVQINKATPCAYDKFVGWWFEQQNSLVDCYFWGDLDYAGMTIIKAMRAKFPAITCWRGAYQAVMSYHQRGTRYAATNHRQGLQRDPGTTGCKFSDTTLLPELRHSQAFTDQEVVGEHELVPLIEALLD